MSHRFFVHASLLFTSFALLGAGCSQKASVSMDTPPKERPSATTSDTCGNPYFGYRTGLTISYSVTPFEKLAGDSDYTTKVVSMSGNKVTIRTDMAGGVTSDMEIDCASGSVSDAQNAKFKTTIVASSGTFMPPNVKAGSTWDSMQKVKMESSDNAVSDMGPLTIITAEQGRAVAEESITVQAGTYKAIKVEVKRTTTTEFSGMKLPPGTKLPASPPTISKSTEWWVKNIGMVKSTTIQEGNSSSIEAKSVTGI